MPMAMNNDYLVHYGVLGQKWGQRNGPPYPLSDSAHSSAEKKAIIGNLYMPTV